jgi:hypothetical protein
VDLDKSEMVRVALKMGTGELSVAGGSTHLLDADFDYSAPSRAPVVRYRSSGVRGDLTVQQPNLEQPTFTGPRNGDYKWDLRLNDSIPLDVVANLGVGEARLDLGDLTLRSVEVHMGVGELTLDLRGSPRRDFDVSIHGGVGQATVYLPADAAISAVAQGGIGNISVQGLEKHNGRWVNPTWVNSTRTNPAHPHAAAAIHLDIHGGVGEIRLIAG